MKHLSAIILAFCLAGCTHYQHVEFSGTITGVASGVFVIKDIAGHTIYGENIKDGKFHIDSKGLEVPGYYTMDLIDEADASEKHTPFEIYLEDGKYTIDASAGRLADYPKITSSSPVQQQLSAYYELSDQMNGDLNKQLASLNATLADKATEALPQSQYIRLLNHFSELDGKKREIMSKALDKFVTANPQNTIGAHIMLRLDYENDPLFFNNIYQKLSPETRGSDDGKEMGEKLGRLVKLVPGAVAPAISGKLLHGGEFNPKAIPAKIYLIDFWRAGNDIARTNHQDLKNTLAEFGSKGFAVISVSMDTKADWWSNAVKEDGMTWAQVSDLKGDDSPNALNWSITRMPRYDLLDGSWHIIERDAEFKGVYLTVKEYLEKHP